MIRLIHAEIDARTTSGGQYRYGWFQVQPDETTGTPEEPVSSLSGTTTDNYAIELNNTEVAVGTRVLLRQYGYVSGQMIWAFAAVGGGAGDGVGVYGQATSVDGELVAWSGQTGQWVKGATGIRFIPATFAGSPGMQLIVSLPWLAPEPHPSFSISMYPSAGQVSTTAGTVDYDFIQEYRQTGSNPSFNGVRHFAYFRGDDLVYLQEDIRLNNNAAIGGVSTEYNGTTALRKHNIQNWMAHYTSTGTAGLTGTLCAGATATEGVITSLGTLTSAYTTSNVSTDRSFDADATTLDELADVLGTLIADLKAKNILG